MSIYYLNAYKSNPSGIKNVAKIGLIGLTPAFPE